MTNQINQATVDEIVGQLSEGAEKDVRCGYLTGQVKGNEVTSIDGVYVPEQKSSRACSTIVPEEVLKAQKAISQEGKTIVGFVQYNAQFSAFESPITRKSFEDLDVGPKIGLVVNAKGEHKFFQ